ncbi:MAG: hypothetical protein H9882_02540 [Candidatus Fournierella pullistercoris]|uniref:Uncharacterized protein n=1 Tax=Candidatus Allofournierella pullistercoris TaxID=2838597 RepID=A0A948T1P8_9FIRM|nr:hypothetical protein [Candidatus Fournierella pullistercoris]
MEQNNAETFKTSLMGGYSKEQVAAHLEKITKEQLAQRQEQEQKYEELRLEKQQLEADRELLLEKTKEVCQQLVEQERANRELESKLEKVQEQADTYKTKLFAREQEAALLRADVNTLQSELAQLEETLEEERSQAEERYQAQKAELRDLSAAYEKQGEMLQQHLENKAPVVEPAVTPLERVRLSQHESLRRERRHMAEQAKREQDEMRKTTRQLAQTVQEIRQQLEQVDLQLNLATQNLRHVTDVAHQALGQTEQSLEQLQEQVNRYPRSVPSSKVAKCAVKEKVSLSCKRNLSDSLLELLDNMMQK